MDGFTGSRECRWRGAAQGPGGHGPPFHVVSLAGDKLDECRRRIQRAITGRRGRAGDRLYRARRTLLTGAGLLTDAQAERLEALFADDRHAAVQAAWGVYQRLIQAYRTEEAGLGKYLMRRLIDSLRQAVPDGLEEIQALARTLTSRSQDILAYFDQPRTSNGPRQAINGRLEHLRGIALGLAQPGQLHHPQPHPHRTPQRPPDNNHLNQPISPTYHTPKHEEPLNQPPQNPGLDTGYNKRLRALAGTIGWLAAALATTTSVYTDDVHLVDSTPIECARSRPTVMRSDLAGWAGYGYCASHSRFFRGLRLHLVCTVHAPARGLGPGGRQGRRTRDPVRRPGAHGPAGRTGSSDHRRQELLRHRLREPAHPRRDHPGAPHPQSRI